MMAEDDDPGAQPEPDQPRELADLGERAIIERIKRAATAPEDRVVKGIGDDAAVIAADLKTAVSTDLLVDSVHFDLKRHPPRLLGKKALAVNLSDLAAMASKPAFCVLGLAAPTDLPTKTLDQIIDGFTQRARESGTALVGGDLCRARQLTLAVTVFGDAPAPGPVYRSGARVGDLIFVTGTVGDSALGLTRLLSMRPPLDQAAIADDDLAGPLRRHLDPEPRIIAGPKLAGKATAMIDLSDGIVSDLGHVLVESEAPGAVIETPRLPLSPAFRSYFNVEAAPEGDALRAAVAGGEDYELLFTAKQNDEAWIMKLSEQLGLPIVRIGEIRDQPGLKLMDEHGAERNAPDLAFEHFRGA